jgi:N-acyl-D-amino-acid deacylase
VNLESRRSPATRAGLFGIVAAGAAVLCAFASSSSRPFDLVIERARVVDGTGAAWYRADVAIRDGRIVRVGRLSGEPAARVIDAQERVLAPGFVDVHTHVEGNLPAAPDAVNLVADGVTTVVTGNCGGSETDLAGWFGGLEASGIAVNVASLIGHNSVRAEVMGYANRAPSADELYRMEALVDRAMRDGAVGFSTGLVYAPGTFSRPEEIAALARVAARHGGLYATHMRSENDRLFPAIDEAIGVAREARIPLEISHYKVTSRRLWGAAAKMLDIVDAARREGLDVTMDQYPYTASASGLAVLLPDWVLESPVSARHEMIRRLKDPAERRRIAAEMTARLSGPLGHDHLDYAVVARCPWDPALEGRSIRQINSGAGGRPARPDDLAHEVETVLDMCLEGGESGRGSACGTQMVYHTMDESDVERIFESPLTMVARDGGVEWSALGAPHPRSYGSSARVLSRFVRERGLVSLEEAVRKMTSLPAGRFGFADRGLVKEGFRADLVLFDPDEVQDLSTFETPHRLSRGFDLVVVNGQIVREEGTPTCARPGMVLRGRGASLPVIPSVASGLPWLSSADRVIR